MTEQSLKRQVERASADNLLAALDIKELQFDHIGDDMGEPDIVYRINGRKIGIEVAQAYLDNKHAKYEWDFARDIRKNFGVPHELQVNPSDKLCEFIKKVLDNKCTKSFEYSGVDETWLCIEGRNPSGDSSSIEKCVRQLHIKDNNFKHIYLLHLSPWHQGGQYKAFDLK